MASINDELRAAIEQFWDDVVISEAELPAGAEAYPDTLDSYSAVDVLIVLEKIVGVKLEASDVIRRGGYESREQFVEHLSASVTKFVEDNAAGAKK